MNGEGAAKLLDVCAFYWRHSEFVRYGSISIIDSICDLVQC